MVINLLNKPYQSHKPNQMQYLHLRKIAMALQFQTNHKFPNLIFAAGYSNHQPLCFLRKYPLIASKNRSRAFYA